MTDKRQKKVYLTDETAELMDAHDRSNSDLVESALRAYLRSGEIAEIQRQVDELERRRSNLVSERNARDRSIDEIDDELGALRKRLDRMEDQQASENEKLEEAIAKLTDAPRDPTNPAIQTQAKRLGMTPEELIDELPERDGGDDINSL